MSFSLRKSALPVSIAAVSIIFSSATSIAQTSASDAETQRYVISYICGDARIDGSAPLPSDGRPYNLTS